VPTRADEVRRPACREEVAGRRPAPGLPMPTIRRTVPHRSVARDGHEQAMSAVSEHDREPLARALANLLAAVWRRREQEKAAGDKPAAGEEVRDDDGAVTRASQ